MVDLGILLPLGLVADVHYDVISRVRFPINAVSGRKEQELFAEVGPSIFLRDEMSLGLGFLLSYSRRGRA